MISAFVPTLNNEKTIRKVLRSLKAQSLKPKRIIVIDSGSSDETEKIVKEEGCEFYEPSYFCFEFLGLGRARNRILELIDTPYLLSVDSDILLDKDYIEKILPLFEQDSAIAGIAGKQIELNRIHLSDIARALVDGKDLLKPVSEQEPMYRNFLMGSNSIYKVEALRQVGKKYNDNPCRAFNDALTSNYEDVDIGNKLRSLGYKLYWTPKILTYHLQKDNLETFINRAYRYKLFEWKLNKAFNDKELYKKRINQVQEYVKRGFTIAYDKSRTYLAYPFFIIGFKFFLEDIKIFIEQNNSDFAKKIYNSFVKSLDFFVSEFLKEDLLKKCRLEGFEYDENDIDEELFAWFVNLAQLDFLAKDFPAKHDFKLESVEKTIQIKAIESGLRRVQKEEKLNIYGDFKALLLNPTWKSDERYGVRAGSRWPHTQNIYQDAIIPRYIPFPFFLSYTYALLQQENISSWISDAVSLGYNDDECLFEVVGYEPDIILIETSTPSFYTDLAWAQKIKHYLPTTKICFCGTHIAYEKENILTNPFIDFAIEGEYEEAFVDLCKALKENKDYKSIQGLIYKDEEKTVANGKTKKVNFVNFPQIIHEIMPLYNYNDRTIEELLYPSLQVQLSRGCPYKCSFCLWPQVMFNAHYQKRDLHVVLREIKNARENFGIHSFYVDDDTFNVDRAHLLEFARLLKENEINLPWMAMARADTITDKKTLKILKNSGLTALKFGIESVNEVVLEEMQKGLNLEKCEESIATCKELGIQIHLTFSIGYFNDTLQRIRESFLWLIEQNPDSMQLSIVTPFPGTKMYEQALEKGYALEKDFSKYDGARYSVVTSSLPKNKLQDIQKNWIQQWRNFKQNATYDLGFLE